MDIWNAVLKNLPKTTYHSRLKHLRSKSKSELKNLFCEKNFFLKLFLETVESSLTNASKNFRQKLETFRSLSENILNFIVFVRKKLSSNRYKGRVDSCFRKPAKKIARKPINFPKYTKMVMKHTDIDSIFSN